MLTCRPVRLIITPATGSDTPLARHKPNSMSAAVDSPLALGLFRFGMRQVWMFELIDALPLFITLPFILPLAIISLAIGHLFQLSRRIRHGSVHGPGAGSGRVLRTPDECFANLPDYPFEPHYWEHDGRRLHYIDEGAGQGDDGGEVVLMLHGEPTWSYLYRKFVGPLVAAGHRVVIFSQVWLPDY